jgi:hypothetical protein
MSTTICCSIGFDPWLDSSVSDDGFFCRTGNTITSHAAGNLINEQEVCLEPCISTNSFLESCMEPTPIGPYGVVNCSIFNSIIPANASEMKSFFEPIPGRSGCTSKGVVSISPFPRSFFPDVTQQRINLHRDELQEASIGCTNKRSNLASDFVRVNHNEVNESWSAGIQEVAFPPLKKLRPNVPWATPAEKEEPELEQSLLSCVDNDAAGAGAVSVTIGEATKGQSQEVGSTSITTPVDNRFSFAEDEIKERFRIYQNGQWNEKFAELVEFQTMNGHCIVPHNYVKSPALAQWVKRYDAVINRQITTMDSMVIHRPT